ncbi:TIGR00341 family protein [Petrimonas sp.]|uniref:TIGR00341 family protein n=1 Tax=Petrimonas sp. TaxID=2023866 RepID=UPI003F512DD1
MEKQVQKLVSIFNLRSELENYETIHAEIEKGIQFRGTNLWILMFAIVVASVGLNMNSTAVIIGAMLISPLMGPINGVGYSLATYDFHLFRRSVKNLMYAVVVSLLTSSLYFFLSPINEAHSELLARTSPTIYDVLIALFGGLAGIVAISSKLKGNVIPGVAIATALMPPICTAGYGLATLQFNFFFGALYLFAINTVFIAFASLVVSQYLKLPIRSIVDPDRKKQVNQALTVIILITAVPSIYFGYQLVQNENFSQNAEHFINQVSVVEGNYLQKSNINPSNKNVDLVYSGYGLSERRIDSIRQVALFNKIDTSKLKIRQGFEVSFVQENTRRYQSETEILNNRLNATTFALKQSENRIDSIRNIHALGEELLAEIKALYPQIKGCSYTETYSYFTQKDSVVRSNRAPLVIFSLPRNSLRTADKNKIEEWLKSRLRKQEVFTYFDETR